MVNTFPVASSIKFCLSGREARCTPREVYLFPVEDSAPGWLQVHLFLTRSKRSWRKSSGLYQRREIPSLTFIDDFPQLPCFESRARANDTWRKSSELPIKRKRSSPCCTTTCLCELQEDTSACLLYLFFIQLFDL